MPHGPSLSRLFETRSCQCLKVGGSSTGSPFALSALARALQIIKSGLIGQLAVDSLIWASLDAVCKRHFVRSSLLYSGQGDNAFFERTAVRYSYRPNARTIAKRDACKHMLLLKQPCQSPVRFRFWFREIRRIRTSTNHISVI